MLTEIMLTQVESTQEHLAVVVTGLKARGSVPVPEEICSGENVLTFQTNYLHA